jgi:predicted ATPase
MKITYCKDGFAIPDDRAEQFASIVRYSDLRVSSELVVHYARVLVAEGVLSTNTIFEYEVDGVVVCSQKADKNGRLKEWPKGFCDHLDSYLDRLLNIKEED